MINVSAAFEISLEEIEAEIDFANGVGARAFECRDYDKAKAALEQTGALTAFRDKAADLRKAWEQMASATQREEDEEARAQRRSLGKLRKGMRTPESAYYIPMLEVLDQMGGGGKMADVLERVLKVMKPNLKPVDFEPLASGPDNPRWRNAAQWARNTMVRDGLLKVGSPRGVWEINDKGRQTLKDSGKQGTN